MDLTKVPPHVQAAYKRALNLITAQGKTRLAYGLIHSCPTAGKSTLASALEMCGLPLMDTDLLITALYPDFFKRNDQKDRSAVKEVLTMLDRVLGVIDPHHKLCLLTNMTSIMRTDPKPGDGTYAHLAGYGPVISFFRRPEDLVKCWNSREQTKLSLNEAETWYTSWATSDISRSGATIVLNEGEHLDAYLPFLLKK